jgi:hypothetical protein
VRKYQYKSFSAEPAVPEGTNKQRKPGTPESLPPFHNFVRGKRETA